MSCVCVLPSAVRTHETYVDPSRCKPLYHHLVEPFLASQAKKGTGGPTPCVASTLYHGLHALFIVSRWQPKQPLRLTERDLRFGQRAVSPIPCAQCAVAI